MLNAAMRMAWWISFVSGSRICWPGWTWARGNRVGIARCMSVAASRAASAACMPALMVSIIVLVTTVVATGGGVDAANSPRSRVVSAECSARLAFSICW